MLKQVTNSNQSDWKPLIEEGINTKGLFVKPLRIEKTNNRPLTFLLKFEPGATYPYHNHPAGEEAYVLEGEIRFGADKLTQGSYLYTPPGEKHGAHSKKGAVILLSVPEEVEITDTEQ